MPLWSLLYEGISEQLGYTVESLLKEIGAGRALSSAGLAFSTQLVRPLRKFVPAAALGAPSLLDVPFKVESKALSPEALARMARSLPFQEMQYERIFGKRGLAEKAGIPPSALGQLSSTGEPLELALYHRIETEPMFAEGAGEVEGGVYRDPGGTRQVTDPTIFSREAEVSVVPRWMKTTHTPYYHAVRISLRRDPGYSQSLREVATDALSENPSEKGAQLINWLTQVTGEAIEGETDPKKIQRLTKTAASILRNMRGTGPEQAYALAKVIEFHPEMGKTMLWGGQDVPSVIRMALPPGLPQAVVQGSEYGSLVLARELAKIHGPDPVLGRGRPATLPAKAQKAMLLGIAEELYGEGTSTVLPAVQSWLTKSDGAAAHGMRQWFTRTFGRVPGDEGQLIMDTLHLSRSIAGSEGLKGMKLMNRGLMQGMLRMYLDDVAAAAIPTAKTAALDALYNKVGRAFLGAMKPGTVIKGGVALGLITLFATQSDLIPKAEAAGVAPEVGKALGEAVARSASRQSAAVVGDLLDEAFAALQRSGPQTASWLQSFWKSTGTLLQYTFIGQDYVFRDQMEIAAKTLRPELQTTFRRHSEEFMQRMAEARPYELAMRNNNQDLIRQWNEWAVEDGAVTRGELSFSVLAGPSPGFLKWLQKIEEVRRRGPQYLGELTPRQRLAHDVYARWDTAYFEGAQAAGSSADPQRALRPARLNHFANAYDPVKVAAFLKNPEAIRRLQEADVPQREQALMDLSKQGFDRFMEEVRGSLGTKAADEIQQQIQEHPESFRTIARNIAIAENKHYLAILQSKIRAPGLSQTVEEIVQGEMGILPGERGIGDLGHTRPPFRSPFLTNPQRLPKWLADALKFDDPRVSILMYGDYAAKHIAGARAWGADGEWLSQYLRNMTGMMEGSYEKESISNMLRTAQRMIARQSGQEVDLVSRAARSLIPLAIVSRMRFTAIPHFFQMFNAAAVTSWQSMTRAALEMAGGDAAELDRLVGMSGNLTDFSLARDIAPRISSAENVPEVASRIWLGLIAFRPVRRLLLQMGTLSGHYEITERLQSILASTSPQEAAAKVTELRQVLRRFGFGRAITLENDAKMAEALLTDARAGKIVSDPRAMARMERFQTPAGMYKDPYLRVLNVTTNLIAQNFNPWEFPAAWQTPLGRIVTLFRRFFFLQSRNVVNMAFREAREGNLNPLMTLAIPYTVSGDVLLHVRSWVRGKPSPEDDPRKRPLMIGGMTMPAGFARYVESSMDSGAFGLGEELYRAMLAPNQPFLGLVGLITGLIPLELMQMMTTGAQALGDILKFGVDPVRTRDFANARRFAGMWANLVPFIGERVSRRPPFTTGRSWYLQRKRDALDAFLSNDFGTFVQIQNEFAQEMLPDVSATDIQHEMERRQARRTSRQVRPPLAGQPGYSQYQQSGTYPGQADQPVELPAMPRLGTP
jgi:hypothetical protein